MKTLAQLAALLTIPGCIIGTWPTPEMRDDKSEQATAEDSCDGVDNDADGVIDEGCACGPGDLRGCVGQIADQCGLGVQQCREGLWDVCESIGPPYSAPLSPGVTILDVDPASLARGGTETLTVSVRANAACAGIQVARVEAALSSTSPVVRVRAVAHDDGVAPDVTAGDGIYTTALVNAFGPGVLAQTLTLRVTTTVGDQELGDLVTLELEEP